MKPIGTALLAYGMSGKVFHAPFLHTHPGFELKAVWERTQAKAHLDYPQIKSYPELSELLQDESLELVVVNTPNFTHFENAQKALQAGKHVLIEKPVTSSSQEFLQLLDLAKSVNKHVFVYQNRRWSSDICSAKKQIASGKLGDIIEMHLRFDRYRPEIGPKAFKETTVPASGIGYDLGAHLVDQAISIFGKPTVISKYKNSYREHTQVDDYFQVHLQFQEKISVFITASLLVAEPQKGIVIHGTKGSFSKPFCDTQENQLIDGLLPTDFGFGVEPPQHEGALTHYDDSGNKQRELVPGEIGDFNALFTAVHEAIRLGKAYPILDEEILWQLQILES
jgi:predicted dehydrogenase